MSREPFIFFWRAPPITHDIVTHIVQLVRAGIQPETAAASKGIDEAELRSWLLDGARAKVEGFNPENTETKLKVQLVLELEQAAAYYEIRLTSLLDRHANRITGGRLTLELLARRFPERWGPVEERRPGLRERMRTAEPPARRDFSMLDDGEMEVLERLIAKIEGRTPPPAMLGVGHTSIDVGDPIDELDP